HGQADLLLDSPPANRLQEIRTQFSAQSHPFTQLAVDYFFLNTKVSPFDNPNVRRALNYAVDRRHMASIVAAQGTWGGGGPVTCQVLPPAVPGFAPYCSFTLNPSSDVAWLAQDVAKARVLVDASGTKGDHVVVWTNPLFTADARYLVHVMNDLGYHAT